MTTSNRAQGRMQAAAKDGEEPESAKILVNVCLHTPPRIG